MYFLIFPAFLSTCNKTPAIYFCLYLYLVTEDSTSSSVLVNVQSQPTLGQWEDRHVRLLIESYLKFKGLIGQRNNTNKGVFDKTAAEFNKHADIKVKGEQFLTKWKKLETKQKEIGDNSRQTGRAHKTLKFHNEMVQCIGNKASITFDAVSTGSSCACSLSSQTTDDSSDAENDSVDSEDVKGETAVDPESKQTR